MIIQEGNQQLRVGELLALIEDSDYEKEELYYAFLNLPPYWAVRSEGPFGAVYQGNDRRAMIYFTKPEMVRNVDRVEWENDKKKGASRIWRIDSYGYFGYNYCSEYYEDGLVTSVEYYNRGHERILVQLPMENKLLLYRKGQLVREFGDNRELLSYLDDVVDSSTSVFMPEAFILTNTDRIEMIEETIEAFPSVLFHIGADTLMSDKLTSLPGKYANVRIYQCISQHDKDLLLRECELYLDITNGVEVYSAVEKATRYHTQVLGYEWTVRNPGRMMQENIVSNKDQLFARIRACIE